MVINRSDLKKPLTRSIAVTLVFGILFSLWMHHVQATERSTELCLFPVRNGQPTSEDLGEARRMVFKVVILPGLPRPIIRPLNRGGVWTIDETDTFVPFGGEFPADPFDKFERDPMTNRIIGLDLSGRLFYYDFDRKQFVRIMSPLLSRSLDVDFVKRFDGFVVMDLNGTFLLDKEMNLSPLPFDEVYGYDRWEVSIDLPEISAILLQPVPMRHRDDDRLFLQFDDGQIVLLATLERRDIVKEARVTTNGLIDIETKWNRFSVNPPTRNPDGSYVEPVDAHTVRPRPARLADQSPRYRTLDAPSMSKTYRWNATGLWELAGDDVVRVTLPFDEAEHGIADVAEFPSLKRLVVFSEAGVFSLSGNGEVEEIPGSRRLIHRHIGGSEGIIPERDEMIVLGLNGLYLLSRDSPSGRQDCPPLGPPHP